MELELSINGVIESLNIAPNELLLSLLRSKGYCSVKEGCQTGDCGACTVLVDGVPRPSCVMLAAQAGGCTLTTVEDLGTSHKLHPLQHAFVEAGAVQCGFCTPGMLLSAYSLLKRNPSPTEAEVRDALSGNLCRCMGYQKPVQAVLRAAAVMRGETVAPLTYNVIHWQKEAIEENSAVAAGAGSSTGGRIPAARVGGNSGTLKIPMLSTATLGGDAEALAIGKPTPHREAVKFVTGKSAFAADINLHNMLYGRILASPHPHAVIRNIDVSQAKALPGVHAILTYKDVPRISYASVERSPLEAELQDQYSLDYIVRYVGDRVAVVAAETPEVAEQALGLIKVEYDVQAPVLDPRKALDPSSPQLHPESESRGIYAADRNIAARIRIERGDVEQGFSNAEVVVEGEYFVPLMQEAPIENHTVVTYFDEDNRLVVRTSTEAPHHVRRMLARILNVSASHIRVIRPEVGGGTGVKQEIVLEDLCALLTVATNRPVMMAYSRKEEFRSSRTRPQYYIRLKTGLKRDGTIIANQAVILTGTGAYGTHVLIGRHNAVANALSLYPCPNMSYIAEVVYTSFPPPGAYRGCGNPQEFFALECHMDEIARKLEIDTLELRRKNWINVGDKYPMAQELIKGSDSLPVIESCGLEECLRIVEEKLSWKEKHNSAGNGRFRRGVGIALSFQGNPEVYAGTNSSGAFIKLNEDGSFDVFVGANDAGNGSSTMLAQIASEVLGVPLESIMLHSSSTDTVPFEAGANGSATLYASGGAVQKAAEQLRRQVFAVAGRMLDVLPESLKISSGTITASGGQSTTVQQVAAYSFHVESRHIMSTASWKVQYTPAAFAAQGVEVEVDSETGSVRILKAITAVDSGRVINPQIVEGQVQGNTIQGLGAGVCEELIYDQDGKLLSTDFGGYHIYNALEAPEVQAYLVETNDPSVPMGTKAVAEIPSQGMAPAIANAVADALGVRIRMLPLTPERVLRAIHAQAQSAK